MAFRTSPRGNDDGVLACPRDGSALVKTKRNDTTLDRCSQCGGLWFDHRELSRVAHSREVERLAERVSGAANPSGFACPRCGGPCYESHVGDVTVDTCSLCHGVWLDAGELADAENTVETKKVLGGSELGFRAFLRRL